VAKPHTLIGPARHLGSLLASYSQSATKRRVMWLDHAGWSALLRTRRYHSWLTSTRVQQDAGWCG